MKQINIGDFSDLGAATELSSHVNRLYVESDIYKNIYTFNVRVLTKPLPHSPDGTITTGFKFKGRIVDSPLGTNRPPSPHRLLPDPCRMDAVGNDNEKRNQIARIIAMHTEFISGVDTARGAVPNVGDEVVVKLKPGNYSYNVQQAQFTSLFIHVSYSASGLNLTCDVPGGLASLFPEGGGDLSPRPHPQSRAATDQTPETIGSLAIESQFGVALGRSERDLSPSGITIHNTAGGTLAVALKALANRALSYHFIIDKDGTIHQLVKTNLVAIHDPVTNPTNIGISFVNLGHQSQFAGRWGSPELSEWVEGIQSGKSATWEPYPSAQIAAGESLVAELKSMYPTITTLVSHSDTASGKEDPGPAFPINQFKALVSGGS